MDELAAFKKYEAYQRLCAEEIELLRIRPADSLSTGLLIETFTRPFMTIAIIFI